VITIPAQILFGKLEKSDGKLPRLRRLGPVPCGTAWRP